MLRGSLDEFEEELAGLPVADLRARLGELEELRRRVEAATAVVLADLDQAEVWRHDGHASIHGMLRSSLHWSEGEIRSRMRLSRLVSEHRDVGEMLWAGDVSMANAGSIARLFANSRLSDRFETVVGQLANEATRSEHDDFRRLSERWQLLNDRQAPVERAEIHERRDARLTIRNGRGRLVVEVGDLQAAQLQEIFDRFVEAEFDTDWAAAGERHGEATNSAVLARTTAQRRADAVCKVFERAVSAPPGSRAPKPVTHLIVDWHTACELAVRAGLFPERNVDPFDDPGPLVSQLSCETTNGVLVNPDHVLAALVEGYVRFVVHNDHGVPIKWGRLRRLFTGAARDAVISLLPRCTAPGCRRPAEQCEAGHLRAWVDGGRTDPDNGGPECRRHNQLKHRRRWRSQRDPHGHFHTYRPDGTEII